MSVGGAESGQDVDLNLAPIIDCFTVLITYLLVTASFLSLTALDVGVSAIGVGAATNDSKPPMVLSLVYMASGEIKLNVRGGVSGREYPYRVPSTNGRPDEATLMTRLLDIKKRWPDIGEASLSAEPTVVYRDFVKLIKKVQEAMPKVLISSS